MEVVPGTFLLATAVAALPALTVGRHRPVLRRCVAPTEAALLITQCRRPEQPYAGAHLLLLTKRRMVVTRETRVLHRVQLHLAADVRELSQVTWICDPRRRVVELAATAVDGVRERFWLPAGGARQAHLDMLFRHVFRTRTATSVVSAPPPARSRERHPALATA